MVNEKRLIDADTALQRLQNALDDCHEFKHSFAYRAVELVAEFLQEIPAVDAVEVVHGRWGIIGGDLHSNGYPVVCTVCNKAHFVHYKKSLGGLNLNELFELPNYCPNCGAKMDGDGNG